MAAEQASRGSGNGKLRQSLSWWCYCRGDMTPEKLCREAKRIGYEAVELVDEAIWPIARDNGLAIAGVGGHRSLTDGLNKRENHDRIEREIAEKLEKAREFHIPNLLVFSGNRNGLDDETGAQITAEGLRRVAPLAEQAGITLVMELLNSKRNHPDYQADRTPWGVKVCEMVGSPRVKLLYDIYHMQIMEGDVIATIKKYHPYISHYHTGGVPGRNEIDESQELYYPAIMKAIVDTGFKGYVAQEFIPKREDKIASLKQGVEICDV